MAYVKPSPGPIEERDFDPVVPCASKFRDISEFPDGAPDPEMRLSMKEELAEVLARKGVALPTLCAECDGPTPNCPNCRR
jgi:hypothetical protein